MNKIKLAICDDNKYLCEGYKSIFMMEKNLLVLWTATSIDECMERLAKEAPDVLLLDIQMNTGTEGIEAIKAIKDLYENVRIIMLTGYNAEEYIARAFAEGASNYVLKDDSDENIIETINDVYNNKVVVRGDVAEKLIKRTSMLTNQQKSMMYLFNTISKLTRTEFEVLQELLQGKTYREISDERYVEENTVRKIASNILSKFGAKNMKSLITELINQKILELFNR